MHAKNAGCIEVWLSLKTALNISAIFLAYGQTEHNLTGHMIFIKGVKNGVEHNPGEGFARCTTPWYPLKT